jgi:hypothetical protein
MAATIQSLRNAGTPLIGVSRDDLRPGDIMTVSAVNVATTYSWSMAFKPEGSAAAFSGDPNTATPGDFTVDLEGPYLIRLVADVGLPTQTEEFVALRFLTIFADLQLVAAGEQNQSGVPVPVDAGSTGWADAQNRNIQVLLGFIAKVSSSGRILYVDANALGGTAAPDPITGLVEGYGDYATVQAAIDAAEAAGAGLATPWLVVVRPGLYIQDVLFKPHVHVMGLPGNNTGGITDQIVSLRCSNVGSTGTHEVTSSLSSDRTVLTNLTLENNSSSPTAASLRVTGPGEAIFHRCNIAQNGIGATVGAALGVEDGVVLLDHCEVQTPTATFIDRVAVLQTGGTLRVRGGLITGTSGLSLNPDLVAGVRTELRDVRVDSTGAAGSFAIRSSARYLLLEYARIQVASGDPLLIHPSGAAFAGGSPSADVRLTVRWSYIEGMVVFNTAGLSGDSLLELGSSEYTSINLPGGSPTVLTATTKATSLFYNNATTGITAENVQDAIDEVHALAVLVTTLDDAYDGGVGGGLGRRILADSGAVEIVDAPAPSVIPPPGNSDGRLRVVGGVEVGSIGEPELDLDPNPYGQGPMLRMGRLVVPNNAPFLADALVLGASSGTPNYRNFNLRVGTESSEGGTRIGRLILRGGDAYDNGGVTPDAASVYVQAGTAKDAAAGEAGNIFLVPGLSTFGAAGGIIMARAQDAVAAVLTAAGAFVGGVAGNINFATNMGGFTLAIGAGDNLAAVLAAFNATGQVTAVDSGGGVIELTSFATGPNSLVYFLVDDQGGLLDIALGVFDGVAQVDGSWPSTLTMGILADQEIAFGIGGGAGPMIYNATTGKLTVPGVIDPTAIIYDTAPPIVAGASKGVTFVGDGTGGSVLGNFYYRYEGGALQNLSAGGGGSFWPDPLPNDTPILIGVTPGPGGQADFRFTTSGGIGSTGIWRGLDTFVEPVIGQDQMRVGGTHTSESEPSTAFGGAGANVLQTFSNGTMILSADQGPNSTWSGVISGSVTIPTTVGGDTLEIQIEVALAVDAAGDGDLLVSSGAHDVVNGDIAYFYYTITRQSAPANTLTVSGWIFIGTPGAVGALMLLTPFSYRGVQDWTAEMEFRVNAVWSTENANSCQLNDSSFRLF